MSDQEARADAALVRWQRLADLLPGGWRVHGWTYDTAATLVSPSDTYTEVTGELRDAFLAAVDAERERCAAETGVENE